MPTAHTTLPKLPERQAIATAIVRLLRLRGPAKTICPSEVARLVAKEAGLADWRSLMPRVRATAARLARRERVVVLQRGKVVDADVARGPIRIGVGPRG